LSSLTGSIVRRLERVLKEFESGMASIRLSIPSVIEYLMVKVVYLGDRALALIVYFSKKLSEYINLLQISMIDSMIIVSLWYGFVTLLLVLLVAVLHILG